MLMLFGALIADAAAQAPYARAGWTLQLSTLAHGVSGRATIIDARTIVLSDFNYDAGGPRVFGYLGATNTQQGFINGISIGGRLNNRLTPYVSETVTLTLPTGQTLDGWNALSIWCQDFNANFGSGTFAAPVATPTPPPQPTASATTGPTPEPTATSAPNATPQQPTPTRPPLAKKLYLPAVVTP